MSHSYEKPGEKDLVARGINKLYSEVEQKVLDSGQYSLDTAQDLLTEFIEETGGDRTEITLTILERFNHDQGALPDELGETYVRLFFSPEAIKDKMLADNLDFHEAVSALALSAKEKKISLDKDLIDQAVDEAENVLGVGVEV